MRYSVIFSQEAENQLADIWLSASDRDAVTKASEKIEHVLKIDPTQGEDLDFCWTMCCPPLRALYEIFPDDL